MFGLNHQFTSPPTPLPSVPLTSALASPNAAPSSSLPRRSNRSCCSKSPTRRAPASHSCSLAVRVASSCVTRWEEAAACVCSACVVGLCV